MKQIRNVKNTSEKLFTVIKLASSQMDQNVKINKHNPPYKQNKEKSHIIFS